MKRILQWATVTLIPAVVLGCVNLRNAPQPDYAFGRAFLNIQLASPVHSHANEVETRRTMPELKRSTTRTRAVAKWKKKSATPKKSTLSQNRRTLRAISGNAVKKRADQDKTPLQGDWDHPKENKRCSKGACEAPGLLSAARRLYGLRMRKEHDFIRHVFHVNDITIKVNSPAQLPSKIYATLKGSGALLDAKEVQAGDLVFFKKTNASSTSDQATLVGVVERVNERGTVYFLAQVSEVVDRSVVTPSKPGVRRDERSGVILNSFVRTKSSRDVSGTAYLSGQLLLGFGRATAQ